MHDLLDVQGDVDARRHAEKDHGGHDACQRRRTTPSDPLVAAQHGGDGLLGLRDDGERLAVTGLPGVAEDHLPKVGAAVVDVGAVAFHDRPDDRQHRIKRAWGGLGIRPAPLERFGVGGVLHEQEELALGLCIEEQRPGAYVGLVGYLLGRDLIDAV